ncbi:splicing factor Prp17 [Schizosaccharomyces cryophilus OY26]|uniref:Pre-mRNA-processing factor 17 n=1 Tax=Schizosaccharomyces cryophilus (strain OY26 / ATCC MYA-4695 / CBS 11777 / NBRC 106824 / NRRL Y48691) TaxID=653667 RepID=S9W5M8_SCHCR|nr:splicing factor Prp17 [Schizosaccharomyces cryophilus OY26]EPY53864.1 splicing factor Prp17 [Schizosaccharomyces cryophilus OY26]
MLIPEYSSDTDDQDASLNTSESVSSITINPTPAVIETSNNRDLISRSKSNFKELSHNVPIDKMHKPVYGPANPFLTKNQESQKNTITGYAEREYVPNAVFNQRFNIYGKRKTELEHSESEPDESRTHRERTKEIKKLRKASGDSSILYGDNTYSGPWADYDDKNDLSPSSEEFEEVEEVIEYKDEAQKQEDKENANVPITENFEEKPEVKEYSIFHKDSLFDYQNRTYLHVPTDVGLNLTGTPGEQVCYLPKKHIHTWKGHTKGVSCLRFFPTSGHLLLSGSLDSAVKIWDVYHDRSLIRTFHGHSKPIRDLSFNQSGNSFLSVGFDKTIKLWDTETGKCQQQFATGKQAHCVRFQVDPNRPNEFLAGMSDKKILQFDTRAPDSVQSYSHHLGAVNSITYLENGKRFVTTSDDSSMRFWEYGTPIPIKYVADIGMHSMPRVALRPNGKALACQSLDNCIYVYSAIEKYRQNKKKSFRGFNCSGYSLEVGFSPDGRFVYSGDSSGNACFWDWKTCKLLSKLPAQNGPVQSMAFHPQETSKVATSSILDGIIKYWD